MPLYEYQCKKCKHRFDRIQKFSDPILRKCPECGGVLERLISAPAVQFKGTGWYITDYAKKGAHKPAESSGEAAKESAKSESKPESKPESKKHHDKKK